MRQSYLWRSSFPHSIWTRAPLFHHHLRPLHPAVFEELKRQHDRFSYTGPLTGHTGGVSALAFNRET